MIVLLQTASPEVFTEATRNVAAQGVLGSLLVVVLGLFLLKDRELGKRLDEWSKKLGEIEKSHADEVAKLDASRSDHMSKMAERHRDDIAKKDDIISKLIAEKKASEEARTVDAQRYAEQGIRLANEVREESFDMAKAIDELLRKLSKPPSR